MHIAFLDANTDRSAFGQSHPSECDKFRALLSPLVPDWRWTAFRLPEGERPADLSGFDGIMISGSIASVNDDAPWVHGLMDLIRLARSADTPTFGACFGHQAIAKALGGVVAPNPQGWVLGRVEANAHDPAPWMQAGPIPLHAAHKEQVVAPPPGARIHAGTDLVPHGYLSVGPRIFSTQYHPELDRAFMEGLFAEMDGTVDQTILDAARSSLSKPADADRMARWIVDFFAQAKG